MADAGQRRLRFFFASLYHLRRGPLLGTLLQHPDDIALAQALFLASPLDASLRQMKPVMSEFIVSDAGDVDGPRQVLALQVRRRPDERAPRTFDLCSYANHPAAVAAAAAHSCLSSTSLCNPTGMPEDTCSFLPRLCRVIPLSLLLSNPVCSIARSMSVSVTQDRAL